MFQPLAPLNPALAKLPRNEKLKKMDSVGSLVFMVAITCLFIALEWGGVKHGWFSGESVMLMFFFAIFGITWLYIQYHRGEDATLPGRIMKMRSVSAGAFTSFCMGGAFFILLYHVSVPSRQRSDSCSIRDIFFAHDPRVDNRNDNRRPDIAMYELYPAIWYLVCHYSLDRLWSLLDMDSRDFAQRLDGISSTLWSGPGPGLAATFCHLAIVPAQQRSAGRNDTHVGL